MGVPAFFRWLSRKYPSVVANCIEVTPKVDENGKPIPIDLSEPNPNGVEFDNLYLDMNGIIHPCTHPEDKPAPKDEDEMMVAIFEGIDKMISIVRPRKLLYMAVDGVAPRAKMNQQRSRRFRASKETAEKVLEIAKIRAKLEAEGAILPPPKDPSSHFDSNCITPGTPFMARLSKCLHYYTHHRLNNHPAWKNLKVILSDANVPGEGEHKIMDFIRKQRGQPNHDPNTKHCLCGADADLMMLGLATHEPYFTIIREEFKPNQDRPCDVCGKLGHEMKECSGLDAVEEVTTKFYSETQYLFIRLNVLREYLRRELDMPGLPFEYDFERVIDDWVFMCFFVGNDFLPHLPSLEIREGAIDRLVGLYKKCVYKTGGYLTESGNANLNRVQLIMSDLGVVEDQIFQKRQQSDIQYRNREKLKKKRMKMAEANSRPTRILSGQYTPTAITGRISAISNPRQEIYQQRIQSMSTSANGETAHGEKRKHEDDESESEEEQNDEVRLWESGFKDRYYESKFDVTPDNKEFRYKVAFQYVRGLCWVLQYYYQGCPSWKWYFPYHYAPFASDFINIAESPIIFEKGTRPYRPLEQLMGVFPAGSKSHVPEPWSRLMEDPDSPIIDFYPVDFKIDLNGQKAAWRGVALLPFAEEDRLFKALEPYYDLLNEDEKKRNVLGDDRFYICEHNTNYKYLKGLYENKKNFEEESSLLADGVLGRVILAHDCVNHGATLVAPVTGLEVIYDNRVICVRYRDPKYSDDHTFPATKLKGADEPPTVLKPQNLSQEESSRWRPQIGMARSNTFASIGIGGHRMLNFHSQKDVYSTVPPPENAGYYGRNYGNSSGGWNRDGARNSSYYSRERNQRNEIVDRDTARFGGGSRDRYNVHDDRTPIDRETARFGGGSGNYGHSEYTSAHQPYQSRQRDSYQRYESNYQMEGQRPRGYYSSNNNQRNYR